MRKPYIKMAQICDCGFAEDAYMPEQTIVYDDALNERILDVIRENPIHYGKMIRHHADLMEYINRCTAHMPADDFSMSVRIYWTLHKWQDFPKCPVCGMRLIVANGYRTLKLKLDKNGNIKHSWPKHCCLKHSQQDENTHKKFVETCQRKYGCDNVFQVEKFKAKMRDKWLKHYGVTVPAKSPIILKKMQDTCMERLGVPNPYQSKAVQQKMHDNYMKKTGYYCPMQNPEVIQKMQQKQLDTLGYLKIEERNKRPGYEKFILGSPYDEPLFSFDDFMKRDVKTQKLKFKCKKCGTEFESIHDRWHKRCPNCYREDYDPTCNKSISSLNRRLYRILDDYKVEFKREFYVKDDDKYRIFDIKIGNVLVEANGDYWHANPSIFVNPDDQISFPEKVVYAKDIWAKDAYKKELAEKNGYK